MGDIVREAGGHIEDDGSIVLPEKVLFEAGRADISDSFNSFLSEACVRWLSALQNADLSIASAQIEGHASSEWNATTSSDEAYRRNLDLSQERAKNVLNACLEHVTDIDARVWAQKHLTAVGYSSAKPVTKDGNEIKDRSRRVVFSVAMDQEKQQNLIEEEISNHLSLDEQYPLP